MVELTLDELKTPTRRFYNRKVQRYVAEQIRDKMAVKSPKWTWHVGLTLTDRVGLDIDWEDFDNMKRFSKVEEIAKWVANYTQSVVGIFETAHGYWIIASAYQTPEEFVKFYKIALSMWFDYIDVVHAMLSIKFNKTTFRLDNKNGVGHRLILTVTPTLYSRSPQ
jgi:hypothetical protein